MATLPVGLLIEDNLLIPGPPGPAGPAGPQGEPGGGEAWRYTGVSGDNKAAFDEFLADAVAAGVKRVRIGSGRFEFASKPTIPASMWLDGEGSRVTQLVRAYSGDFIEFGAAAGFGGGLQGVSLQAGAGTSGGGGLLVKAAAAHSPDYAAFSDLVITNDQQGGGGTWAFPLVVDGSLRSSPQGVRDLHFNNVNLFAGTSGALSVVNGVGVNFIGLGTYPAGGTSGNVYVNGGSNTVNFFGANVQGELNLSNLQKLIFFGHLISMNTAGTASKCYIVGSQGGGPIVNNLTSSAVGLV